MDMEMEMEFEYTINPMDMQPIMLLNKVIGGDEGIDGGEFQRELMCLDMMGKECIKIMINSAGGSVIEGLSIASAILACKTPVITINVGIAGSMAGVIFMCAKERQMADYALLMMHLVQGGSDKARPILDNSISMLLAKNSTLSKAQVKKLMDVETWLNYDDCIKNGFATGTIGDEITQKSDAVVFTEKYAYNEIFDYANIIINNNINMKKEKSEIKVEETEIEIVSTQNEDVSIEAITDEGDMEDKMNPFAVCTARVGREDKAKYEACVMAVKKEMGIHNEADETHNLTVEEIPVHNHGIETDEVLDFKNQLDEKDVLIKQLEAEIARMKTAEVEKEITNFINDYVELGKISEDTKDSWVNLCKTDFESTKEVIKSLNINKEAPKFENNVSGDKKPQSFMEMMNFGKKNK